MGGERLRQLLFLLGAWATQSFALVGMGSLSADIQTYQKNRKAERRMYEYAPFLSFHYKMPLSDRHEFLPELGAAWHPSPSPNHSRMSFFLLYAMSTRIWSASRVHYGFGNLVTRTSGPGKSVVMNNGNGSDVFYQPGRASYSNTWMAFLGYEYRLEKYFALRADVFSRPILSKNRTFGFMLSTHLYYF